MAAALVLLSVALPASARRLALVIGNDTYQHVRPLVNARSDATAIAAALRRAGFETTLKQDLNLNAFKAALRSFRTTVAGGDEVVFYFSGHGVQFQGTNYLLPVDIVAESEMQVEDDAVPLQRVLDDLTEQKARFSLAIVDACRDNPFKGAGRAIGGRGLAPVTAANGQMVLYSAGAGQSALDRLNDSDTNPNGVFTRVLLVEMEKPGVPVDQVLKGVRDQVVQLARRVNHDQVPALYDQTIGQFFFRPGSPVASRTEEVRPVASAVGAPNSGAVELAYWTSVSAANDPGLYQEYLDRVSRGEFPGTFTSIAKQRLRATKPTAAPVVAAAIPARPRTAASSAAPSNCTPPLKPVVPDGRIATREQMIAAKKRVESFVSAGDSYLTCLDQDLKSRRAFADPPWSKEIDHDEVVRHTNTHNQMVDDETDVAGRFNAALKNFQDAHPK